MIHEQAEQAVAALRSTVAVRERCAQLLARARRGESAGFEVGGGKAPRAEPRSRWRDFEAGGIDRRAQLEAQLHAKTKMQHAHAMVDLTVVSVLLDADAGSAWKYIEAASGKTFMGSEGLAVASFHAFTGGLFSSDKDHALQADATGLCALTADRLAAAFQVTESNPLADVEGRAILMRRLGEAIQEQPEVFMPELMRPCGLFDMILGIDGPEVPPTAQVAAHDILSHLLMAFSAVLPAGNSIEGLPVGDCWRHAAVRGPGLTDGWVPFHEGAQWLTYSLVAPFEWSGCKVHGLDQLTALPTARNVQALLEAGVLRPRPGGAEEMAVEQRALALALLEEAH